VFDLNNGLNSTSGGEGPAGAALPLILNTSNGTFRNPIKRARRVSTNFDVAKGDLAIATTKFRFVSEIEALEFPRAEICKFV